MALHAWYSEKQAKHLASCQGGSGTVLYRKSDGSVEVCTEITRTTLRLSRRDDAVYLGEVESYVPSSGPMINPRHT